MTGEKRAAKLCLPDDHPDMVNSRDSVMVRLLFSCARFLSEQGMRRMFVDGVKGGEEGFQVLGKPPERTRVLLIVSRVIDEVSFFCLLSRIQKVGNL